MTNILFVTVLIGVNGGGSSAISRGRRAGYLLLFWVLVAVVFVIHLRVGQTSGIRIENAPGLLAMIERASRIFTVLIGILLLPYPLHLYYDVYLIGDWHWFVSAIAILLLFVALRVLWQRRSLWAFGVVLAFSPLVIYLQLMPFTTWSLASERFVFVSVAGVALVLLDLLGRITRPALIGGLVILIVLPSALIGWFRIDDWGNSQRLLTHEYELQPSFHNAVRDRIVLKLLPEKKYVEAAELARQLSRDFATDALLSLIEVEQVYRHMKDAGSSMSSEASGLARQSFCSAVKKLQSAIRDGYAHIPDEQDVSYNNLLRTPDRQLKYRYADSMIVCVGEKALSESSAREIPPKTNAVGKCLGVQKCQAKQENENGS